MERSETDKLDKKWILMIILFYFALLLVHTNVFLSGDDYIYGSFHIEGVKQFFQLNIFSYFSRNGRFLVNLLHSSCLIFDRYLYVLLNPALIILVFLQMIKFIKLSSKESNETMYYVALGLMATLPIGIKRETYYWIAGSFNYIIPLLLLFLSLNNYMIYIRSGKKKFYYILIAFLSAASMEQIGIILIAFFTLEYLKRFCILKKQIKLYDVMYYLFLISGWLTVVLAPGTFQRAGNEQINLIQNMQTLLYNDFYSKSACNLMIMLVVCYYIWLQQSHYFSVRLVKTISGFCIVSLLSVNFTSSYGKIQLYSLWLSITLIILETIIVGIYFWKLQKASWWNQLFLAGFVSQIALSVSAIWGFRTALCWYSIIIIFILYTINNNYNDKVIWSVLFCNALNINPFCGVVVAILYLIKKYVYSKGMIVECIMILSLIALSIDYMGYEKNTFGNKENIINVKNISENTLIIKKPKNLLYAWQTFPLSPYHEMYFKKYYGISEKVKVVYK